MTQKKPVAITLESVQIDGEERAETRQERQGTLYQRDGAQYFSVPNKPIHVHGGAPDDFRWPFNQPGYWMTPMFTLAVGGVGAGDPAAATYPADMLVDYIRIW